MLVQFRPISVGARNEGGKINWQSSGGMQCHPRPSAAQAKEQATNHREKNRGIGRRRRRITERGWVNPLSHCEFLLLLRERNDVTCIHFIAMATNTHTQQILAAARV
jgi:hypothetical protein